MAEEKQTKNPLAAFAFAPKVYFETQNPGEEIVLLLRRHFITNIKWVLASLILIALPFFSEQMGELFKMQNEKFQISNDLGGLLQIYYLLLFGFVLLNFLKWYFNVFLVTSKRVLDVDLIGFLYRRVTEAELEEIQDVSHTQGGIFQILFDYGNVSVQTAGTQQNIEMLKVPHPGKVHDVITDLQAEVNGKD